MAILTRIFFILSFVHVHKSDVTLSVFLEPPRVTLVCSVTEVIKGASIFLMCPGDVMCFQNCLKLVESRDISCKLDGTNMGKKITYTFNAWDSQNGGDWVCSHSNKKSSVFHFKPETKSTMKINKATLTSKSSIKPTMTNPSQVTEKLLLTSTYETRTQKSPSIVNPSYVILLLVILVISLILNIVLVTRDVLTNMSTKTVLSNSDRKQPSKCLQICVKLFCVENFFKVKQRKRGNHVMSDGNPLLSRQPSHNIYEYSRTPCFPPAVIMDNMAYLGSPTLSRFYSPSMYARSKSFPAKPMENETSQLSERSILESTPEISSQIIYDDVADPSVYQLTPIDYTIHPYCTSLIRSKNKTTNPQHLQNNTATSMLNLPLSTIQTEPFDRDTETQLKDAINSRVELSKEMISQADSLLRQADNLLNKKEQGNNVKI